MESVEPTWKPRLSSTGLKPCPFCDSIELTAVRYKGGSVVLIECTRCRATGPIGVGDPAPNETEQEAKARVRTLWNVRGGM